MKFSHIAHKICAYTHTFSFVVSRLDHSNLTILFQFFKDQPNEFQRI